MPSASRYHRSFASYCFARAIQVSTTAGGARARGRKRGKRGPPRGGAPARAQEKGGLGGELAAQPPPRGRAGERAGARRGGGGGGGADRSARARPADRPCHDRRRRG